MSVRSNEFEGRESAMIANALVEHAIQLGMEVPRWGPDARPLDVASLPPGATVPYSVVERLAEILARAVGDEHICLSLLGYPGPPDFGLVGYHAASAPDNETFLRSAYGVVNQVTDVFDFKVDFTSTAGRFILTPRVSSEHLRHLAEVNLACFFRDIQRYVDPEFEPREIRLAHGPGVGPTPYRRLFQCKVLFNQPRYELHFDPELREGSPILSDARLRSALEPYVLDAMRLLGARTRLQFSMQVQGLLVERLRGRAPCIDEIAGHLRLRPRTFQVRLAREGTNFRDLLDHARRFLAIPAIMRGVVAEQLAAELGYEETASFYRAFRRWTGSTPGALRAAGARWQRLGPARRK